MRSPAKWMVALALLLGGSLAGSFGQDSQVLSPGQVLHELLPPGDPETTSVTFDFLATAPGAFTVEAASVEFDTLVEVIPRAEEGPGQPLGRDDDGGTGFDSRLTFEAEAGAWYRLVVRASRDDWGGKFQITVGPGTPEALEDEARQAADLAYFEQIETVAEESGNRLWRAKALQGRADVFSEIEKGVSAVRHASLTVLNARRARGDSTHPFHWAAFVAAGDWR